MGIIFLTVGMSLYVAGESSQQAVAGILSRVGFLLATIWLAWPQLESLKKRSSIAIMIGIVGILLVVAIRPRLFPIAALLIVGSIFLNAAMRRFSSSKRK